MSELPVVDLEPLTAEGGAGSPVPGAVAVADDLDLACREIGFFAVVGHGIDRSLADHLLAAARAFFDLPHDRKDRVAIARSDNHTGWSPIAAERLQPDLTPDLKEALDLGLEPAVLGRSTAPGPNRVNPPLPVPGLEDAVVAYQGAALRASAAVLRGLALALGLPATYFAAIMRHPQCNLRLLHYPPLPATERRDDQLGCGAHSDYGLITLLAIDGNPGLELLRRDGRWVAAEAPPGAIIVNVGDMLARWTNDRYVSTVHRVTSPTHRRRYSIPFFVNPDPETVVEALPSCVTGAEPARYEPVTAGDYLQSRFDDTHTYRADGV